METPHSSAENMPLKQEGVAISNLASHTEQQIFRLLEVLGIIALLEIASGFPTPQNKLDLEEQTQGPERKQSNNMSLKCLVSAKPGLYESSHFSPNSTSSKIYNI